MKPTPRNLLHLGFFAVALAQGTRAMASGPKPVAPADEAVLLTGWLHADNLNMADVTVAVEVGGQSMAAIVAENGRFTISLPANTAAVLRIEKPGHLTKEVTVDTRFLKDGEVGQQRKRHVNFAVILDPVRLMGGLVYPGPVGTIGFDAGGGCVAVARDNRRIPARKQALMEF